LTTPVLSLIIKLTSRGLRSTREWFRNSTNLDRTISALSTLSSDFTDASYNRTVIAIELINEPFPQSPDEVGVLRDFYQRAYGAVRGASKDTDMVVALDAAFQGLGVWEGFMTPPDFYEVAMDTVYPTSERARDRLLANGGSDPQPRKRWLMSSISTQCSI
jgi:aryl-phospho-beta-D-glucosidase BglC (GH1 family)